MYSLSGLMGKKNSSSSSVISTAAMIIHPNSSQEFDKRLGELKEWLRGRGYEDSLIGDKIDKVRKLDREALLEDAINKWSRMDREEMVPLVLTYHPAFNLLWKIVRKHYSILENSEEHRNVFSQPPFIAFRRCKNLKDILVRSKLYSRGTGDAYSQGCSSCGGKRCQVCKHVCVTDTFCFSATGKQYKINFDFDCNSSNVVYLLECRVCHKQYVGSTVTPFRIRFNNYKLGDSRYRAGIQTPQAEFFKHFSVGDHSGFLEDVRVTIIDRLTGTDRMRESFWQYKLDSFIPKGLNVRQVDLQ